MTPEIRLGLRPSRRIAGSTLLAASLSVILGMTFLAGCGSSNGKTAVVGATGTTPTPTPVPTTTPTPVASATPSASLAGRSFTASNLSFSASESGTLLVAVGNDGASIAATLNLLIGSVSTTSSKSKTSATRQTTTTGGTIVTIPLTGTLATGGGFSLHSLVNQGGTSYDVTATGTLSTSGTSGGTTSVTVNGVTATGSFAPGVALTGTLNASYFPLNYNPNLIYTGTRVQDVSEGSTVNPPEVDTSTYPGYSFITGLPVLSDAADELGFGVTGFSLGAITQATLNGVNVNRVEELLNGTVSEYVYYTADASKLTVYGSDEIKNGTQSVDERLSPASVFPLNLTAGQTYTGTSQVSYDGSSTTPDTQAVSFTFNGFETVTTPTGNYNAAKVTETIVGTVINPDGSIEQVYNDTWTYYLVPNIGIVLAQDLSTETDKTGALQYRSTTNYVLTSTNGTKAETRSATSTGHLSRAARLGRLHNQH